MSTRYALVFAAAAALISVSPAFACSQTHTIVRGDNLWTIALRYHIPLARLESANRLSDSSILQLGQTLVVPGTVLRTRGARHAAVHQTSRHAAAGRNFHAHAAEAQAASMLWAAGHSRRIQAFSPRLRTIETRIMRTALRYLGVPYAFGGTGYGGFDCSGFVFAVFRMNGIALPRMADEQYYVGQRISARQMQPGDLVFFETYASGASHVGIYIGGSRFIHASSSAGVRIDSLGMSYYASRYIGARRMI